ncbi:Rpn family recombination-promoting nuclease/putative transposase [Methylotuvimicrobium sp. KM2]|uniref:Rpn family recombination-promoting nuclease/putative transposase n=1 Tax=Methylotuvimicrobium sp. KM2 TaxID=3133976 RepID=UPI003100C517
MCRINPRVDFAFKKLFGSEENKDLLISLINAIVSEEDKVAEVELKNPYNLADYQAGKISILDIKAKSEQGRWFNVEMQISEDYNFDKRAIYYWAKLVTEQLSEGMMFRELKKTVSINILDFNFIPNTPEFHNRYKIINTATGKDDKLHDVFELHYIELRKFIKPYREITTALDRWSTFLTKAHQLDKHDVPEQLRVDPAIIKAITAVDRMFDEDERIIYETRMQALADVESKIASAEEKGMEKGSENEAKMLLQRALHKRFGNKMEKALQVKINQASLAEIEVWFDRVFDAMRLEDVFKEPD